ncbi:MAG: ATPase [Octadecabacter sp.]|nr:ATPase [Octadecabacter sp.]
MAHDPVIIAVDGGGSGCRAAVGTRDRGILAQATGGPANATTDPRGAIQNVLTAVQRAAEQADVRTLDRGGAVAHLGLAGIMSAQQGQTVAQALPFAACSVTDDRPTTAAGALGGTDGFIAAIGTGSFVGRSAGDVFHAVGGWGLALSDQASGAWLGREALVRVLLAQDKVAPSTALTDGLMAHFGGVPNAIVAFSQTATPADYAHLAPQVLTAAQAGDPTARDIMSQGADYIGSALAALGYSKGDPLCLTGGIGPQYIAYLSPAIQQAVIPAAGTALDGAFALARRQLTDISSL